MIDVKNLCKSFGDHQVLKGVNEHIEKGEKWICRTPTDPLQPGIRLLQRRA